MNYGWDDDKRKLTARMDESIHSRNSGGHYYGDRLNITKIHYNEEEKRIRGQVGGYNGRWVSIYDISDGYLWCLKEEWCDYL